MKINFKQQGGAMPPYLSYRAYVPAGNTPQQVIQTQQESQTTSSDKESGKLSDKDLLTMLSKVDGLPSDMNVIINNLQGMYQLQTVLGSAAPSLVSTYLTTLLKTNSAKFSKKSFDDTFNEVKANKGLGEVAITDSGKVAVSDTKHGINFINVDTYLKNPEKYSILTNSNLLYMRAHYGQLAFQNQILNVVQNGIGMEKVAELLKSNLQNMGTDEHSATYGIYKNNGQIEQGVQVLQGLAAQGYGDNTSIDGLYEAKVISKSQAQQAKYALKYLYEMLPTNAKTLLKVKLGGEKGLYDALYNLVMSNTSTTSSIDLTYKGAYEKNGKDKNSSAYTKDSTDTVKLNKATQLIEGLGQDSMFVIQDGTNNGIPVYSTTLPVEKNGSNLGRTTLNNLTSSDLGGSLDFSNVSMGGMRIPTTNMSNIIIDGNAHSIDMIIDINAKNKGIIRPDFKALKRKEQADNEIKKLGIDKTNYKEINRIYQKYSLPWVYNDKGQLNTINYARFIVFDSVASSKAFTEQDRDSADFNDYLKELGTNETKNAINEFKSFDKNFTFSSGSWFSTGDAMYQGTVYIPVKTNVLNSLNGTLTPKQALSLDQQSRNQEQGVKFNWVNPKNNE